MKLAAFASVLTLMAAGCRHPAPPTAPGGGAPAQMSLSSPSFAEGGAIPARFTCDGAGSAPPLEWSGAPAGTKSYVLIVHDPDAPAGDFLHWLATGIPAATTRLPEAASLGAQKNDFGKVGYGGPCPPSGTHHYVFEVYALDLPALPGADGRSAVEGAMRGHVLAVGKLTGVYSGSGRR